jgi:polysaccharide pyruvyl transferase WcaK-like protein
VGWDGRTPVLVVCPINPFEWPVKASVAKYAVRSLTGAYKDSHYRTVYFHNSGPAAEQAYQEVLECDCERGRCVPQEEECLRDTGGDGATGCASGETGSAEKLGGVPVLTSDEYNMYELVSVLRACHMMASSRYHGIVTSMPGLVPSAGITMDERIRNLMRERGHEDLLMTVDDPELEGKLLAALEKLSCEGEAIASGIAQTVVKNLKVMARMGVYFEEEVQKRYPEFPTRRGEWSWEDYLPPMSRGLRELVAA